ncbi:MAG: hypothetical protein ACOY3I_04790, partial [Verrucomicrobiota bacterium]
GRQNPSRVRGFALPSGRAKTTNINNQPSYTLSKLGTLNGGRSHSISALSIALPMPCLNSSKMLLISFFEVRIRINVLFSKFRQGYTLVKKKRVVRKQTYGSNALQN